jgi:hypothetical protein
LHAIVTSSTPSITSEAVVFTLGFPYFYFFEKLILLARQFASMGVSFAKDQIRDVKKRTVGGFEMVAR